MRIIVADCSAEYTGRLQATLPLAKRVLLIKADNSVLIFSEIGSYKPLNWMLSPCTIKDITPNNADDDPATEVPEKILRVTATKTNDVLEITMQHIYSDESYDLGEDPGLKKTAWKITCSATSQSRSNASAKVRNSCAASTRPPLVR
ncbi:cytosolic protein [Bifidobacterium sp. GSD1FS]|uniref:Cytosolic protein n=1 Tax=Bifidobacterium canis TaxID=2610880 RepID=A0A7K1J6I5_9BIFI|nr:cytosolic protein [Bifidobacterium canis]